MSPHSLVVRTDVDRLETEMGVSRVVGSHVDSTGGWVVVFDQLEDRSAWQGPDGSRHVTVCVAHLRPHIIAYVGGPPCSAVERFRVEKSTPPCDRSVQIRYSECYVIDALEDHIMPLSPIATN